MYSAERYLAGNREQWLSKRLDLKPPSTMEVRAGWSDEVVNVPCWDSKEQFDDACVELGNQMMREFL
jgi:hypothetical protein